jgi:lipopolysaccharide transport system permease protein
MKTINQHDSWDKIITSKNKLFDFDIRQILEYKDLLILFVKRDIVSFYKQTILGPLWYFIQPIFTTIIYTYVFSSIANISTEKIPPPLFYLVGITTWNYFSDCVIKTSTVFKDNASIFGKVYFPRIITPLSIVISNLVRFLFQLLLCLLVYIYYYLLKEFNPNTSITVILLPIYLILIAMQGLGIGLIVTALTTKYRDLSYLLSFGIQLMMYATPVVFPFSSLSGNMKFIVGLNPMTFLIEGFKSSMFGTNSINLANFIYSIVITFLILIAGLLLFNKVEKKFIDTI